MKNKRFLDSGGGESGFRSGGRRFQSRLLVLFKRGVKKEKSVQTILMAK